MKEHVQRDTSYIYHSTVHIFPDEHDAGIHEKRGWNAKLGGEYFLSSILQALIWVSTGPCVVFPGAGVLNN